jgi:hypothetical protein
MTFEEIIGSLDGALREKIRNRSRDGFRLTSVTVDADGSAWVQMTRNTPTCGFRGTLEGAVDRHTSVDEP